MVLFYFLFPAHNIWIYTYFLYAPNYVVCVCKRMCRNFEAVRVTIPFRLYYHSIRWRVSVQMCIKHFEKMALITLYILLILSSIQFVQRSNGITWSNCTHMVLSDVSDISHSNRRLCFRRHACFSSVFFFFCCYCSFFQYNVLTFDSLFATRRSIYSNDNVLTSLFQPARLSSFFPALTFACFMDVIRIYFVCVSSTTTDCFLFLLQPPIFEPFFQKSWFANLMKYLVSCCMYVFYNQSIY